MKLYPILRLPQAFGLRNDDVGGTVIASEAKQSTNHKTVIKKQKNKKIHPSIKIQKQKTKEFYELIIIPHTEIATSCKQLSQ